MSWTSIQLGSREHYAVPAALQASGNLDCLLTDAWIPRRYEKWVGILHPSLSSRRSDQLPDSKVRSSTVQRLLFDMTLKTRGVGYTQGFVERNEWFGTWAAKECARAGSSVVFCYSYTARLPFREARKRGALCILGQIDPGPREEEIVFQTSERYLHLNRGFNRLPQKYWNLWREEVAMADKIVVNSAWSAKLLVEVGVPPQKLVEIPLVYAPDFRGAQLRVIGGEIKKERRIDRKSQRLKVLFLGSIILRKGVGQLFDAIKILRNEMVDFIFAGPIGVDIPSEIMGMPNVCFLGPVDKETAILLYNESDVFIFPTLSDGFGLTQLEALGHGLPVIASTRCGLVVEDCVTGLQLSDVTPEEISEKIFYLVRHPQLLARLKLNAKVPDKFHPNHLAPALSALAND